jgi:hypothetical protein
MTRHHPERAIGIALFIIGNITVTSLAGAIRGQTLPAGNPRRDVEATSGALHLVVIDAAHVPSESLTAAAHEVQTIWAAAGLRITWTPVDIGNPSGPDRRLVPVVIRQAVALARPPASDQARRRGRQPLAFLGLDPGGCPASAIQVSLGEVTSLVMSAEYAGHKVRTLPDYIKGQILGRALGRVIAHEVGHWWFGRDHTRNGLMKPLFTGEDLVTLQAPQLPHAWTTGGDTGLVASLRCGNEAQSQRGRAFATLP